jgi:hypothetical protein
LGATVLFWVGPAEKDQKRIVFLSGRLNQDRTVAICSSWSLCVMIVHNRDTRQFGERGREDPFRGRVGWGIKEGKYPFRGLDRDRGFGAWKTVFKKESELDATGIRGTHRKNGPTAHRTGKNPYFPKHGKSVLKYRTKRSKQSPIYP